MADETSPSNHSWVPRWVPDADPPAGQRAAFYRLAAAVRRINELMLESGLPEADLIAAAERAEAFARTLAEGPRDRPSWGYSETANAGSQRAHFDNSPLIGLSNPVAPPMSLFVENGEVVGTVTWTRPYEGPPGHCHGGFVAAAFDEVLGLAQSAVGQPGMTGGLTVRYRKPTPLYREVRFRGRVDRVEGRKIFTSATLHDGDTLCAEAEALFISVDFSRFRDLAGQP